MADKDRGLLNRRGVLGGAAAATVLFPSSLSAEISCSRTPQNTSLCTAGIPTWKFERAETAPLAQEEENWCWAACIQAIFKFHGHHVQQATIVEKVFGGRLDLPADGERIYRAISGRWTDSSGAKFSAQANLFLDTHINYSVPDAPGQAIRELVRGNPFIVGANGHATVATAVTFEERRIGGRIIHQVIVRDPWPNTYGRRPLNRIEYLNTRLLMGISGSSG